MDHPSFTRTLFLHLSKSVPNNAKPKLAKATYSVSTFPIKSILHDVMSADAKFLPKSVIMPDKLHLSEIKGYEWRVDNTYVKLFIFKYKDAISRTFASSLIDYISFCVRFLNRLNPRKDVTISVVPSSVPRLLPLDGVIGAHHVNGGVTTFGSMQTSNIIVYRLEEMHKVLLHELCHLYRFDYFENGNDYVKGFQEKYKIETNWLGLNEAYNESITMLFFIGICIFLQKQPLSWAQFQALYMAEMKATIDFLIGQAAKIMHYNMSHFGHHKESTHTFAYYICKTALLFNTQAFLEFVDRCGWRLDNDSKIHRFVALVNACLDKRSFKKSMANAIQNVPLTRHDLSLRMCRFDYQLGKQEN